MINVPIAQLCELSEEIGLRERVHVDDIWTAVH
jgi:hypothetical protein